MLPVRTLGLVLRIAAPWACLIVCLAHGGEPAKAPQAPSVELTYSTMQAGDWSGRRFREIVPPAEIKRIVRVAEQGFAHHDRSQPDVEQRVQADYDALMAHLIASDVPAGDLAWDAREASLAKLAVLTRSGELYFITVLGRFQKEISAITISGPGNGARFVVSGFQRSAPRQP
jgi:hypothetical protein